MQTNEIIFILMMGVLGFLLGFVFGWWGLPIAFVLAIILSSMFARTKHY